MLSEQEMVDDPVVYLELSLFDFPWRWYVSECEIELDVRDVLFFGYVCGTEREWGYFRLSELEETRRVLIVNYDFEPARFSELKKRLAGDES